MSNNLQLHALFVPTPNGPAVLHLSKSFRVELNSARKTFAIHAVSTSEQQQSDTRFASFHALYGENGCGKTKLMLALCENFGKEVGHRRIGVLFSDTTGLCLVLGQALGGWRINKNTSLQVQFVKHPPILQSVFYSTSPFEQRRRTPLKSLSIQDVSPTYRDHYQSDALDLVRAYPYIKGLGTFIDNVKIELDVKVPAPTRHLNVLLSMWQRPTDPWPGAQRDSRAALFAKLAKYLSSRDQVLFTIDLAIALNATRSSSRNPAWVKRFWDELDERAHLIESDNFNSRNARATYLVITRRVLRHETALATSYSAAQISEFLENRFLGERPAIARKETLDDILQVASEAEWGPDGIASAAVQFGFVDLHLTKLSSGEIAFVSLYSALGRALGKSVSQNYSDPFFVFIDEGETFMHPRWQQRYISNLIDFISKFPNLSCRAHIIISTHSLIVAADAPPNSLFDMQKSVVRNGFGLGPKSILHDVFRVENFAGENASKGINKILSYLKEESEALAAPLIAELAKNLADRDLREYVRRAMIKRGHHAEAERIAG